MIKGILFDLDMCILDTYSLKKKGGDFFEPVLTPLKSSNLSPELKLKIEKQLWTTSLDDTAKLLNIPQDLVERMRYAYTQIEVPDGIRSYGDENYLKELNVKKILVTTGFRRFQETKVEKLHISSLFDEIIYDELDIPEKRLGKKSIFQEILDKNSWDKSEVLVVGDNPHSELGIAKLMGIKTVQTLRPTIMRWNEADYYITSLYDLRQIL